MMEPYDIVKYPLSTEKAVRLMESENTLIFIVNKTSNKKQIKWAVEKAFDAKVDAVRTAITSKGLKKAYVKLKPETLAIDITTALGLA